MKKKIMLLLVIVVLVFGLCGCNGNSEDAKKFKEEYEKLNGERAENGNTIRSISISKNNPIKYASAEEIVSMVKDKKTFVVYFGFAKCPWCRSVVPNLLKAASDLRISDVYYVDVSNIRNTMILVDNDEVIMKLEGTSAYYELLSIFDSVLSDYTLKNSKGEDISAGMKRIYAPNIISVVDGNVQGMVTGISEKQKEAYMKLTDEMNKESYDMIACNIRCVKNSKKVCVSKGSC